MRVETAWVKPPQQVGGLDHLAVQAPCINIYSRLLPGITNVTDRARYYSFYPWLIWALDKAGYTKYDDEFIERLRRADCLFSLIAERHAVTAGGEYSNHAGAMVGSNTLAGVASRLSDDGKVKLSDFSLREGAKQRYFLNKLGGLGQYYLGVLRELKILDGDSSNGIKFTRQIGGKIAASLDAGVNRELFLAVVDADEVSANELEALKDFCPCQLVNNSDEQKILANLFTVNGVFHDVNALPRRRSLQLILHLAARLAEDDEVLSEQQFRACVYSGYLPNGSTWLVAEHLEENRDQWAAYVRNEMLSIAVQGLFYVLLDTYEASGAQFESSTQVVSWFLGETEASSALIELGRFKPFSQCLVETQDWLPGLHNWHEADHEVDLMERIVTLSKPSTSPEGRCEIVKAALRVLLAMANRADTQSNLYAGLVFDKDYFQYYPINLQSFLFHKKNTWASMNMEELLKWLLIHWGIDQHLRVGLRKLRGHSQSTFRIRPSDHGLQVIAAPAAVHTRPRFNQSIRILKDIGALESDATGKWHLSTLGTSILELEDV